jgi:hypothetical protein
MGTIDSYVLVHNVKTGEIVQHFTRGRQVGEQASEAEKIQTVQ